MKRRVDALAAECSHEGELCSRDSIDVDGGRSAIGQHPGKIRRRGFRCSFLDDCVHIVAGAQCHIFYEGSPAASLRGTRGVGHIRSWTYSVVTSMQSSHFPGLRSSVSLIPPTQTASEAEPKWAESKIFLVIEGLDARGSYLTF